MFVVDTLLNCCLHKLKQFYWNIRECNLPKEVLELVYLYRAHKSMQIWTNMIKRQFQCSTHHLFNHIQCEGSIITNKGVQSHPDNHYRDCYKKKHMNKHVIWSHLKNCIYVP